MQVRRRLLQAFSGSKTHSCLLLSIGQIKTIDTLKHVKDIHEKNTYSLRWSASLKNSVAYKDRPLENPKKELQVG
jgi:hypothetical protein